MPRRCAWCTCYVIDVDHVSIRQLDLEEPPVGVTPDACHEVGVPQCEVEEVDWSESGSEEEGGRGDYMLLCFWF
jgi:hypothetical protein